MDFQALSNWTGLLSLVISIAVFLVFFPLNRRKLRAEVRKAETDADKGSYAFINEQLDILQGFYDKLKDEYDALKKRVEGLEGEKKDLEKTNYLYRIAAENLGLWDIIKTEIERIKG